MNTFTKDEIVNMLRNNTCYINFTKKDGTIRKMNATLNEQFIPEDMKPKSNTTMKENDNVVRCFDVDIQDWRSFRVDSINSFKDAYIAFIESIE